MAKIAYTKLDRTGKIGSLWRKKLFRLRETVNQLYFNRQLTKSEIARKKGVSRNFVSKWTKAPDQDFCEDKRGWPKGKRRKYTRTEEKRVTEIYRHLKDEPREFYLGATAIAQEWLKRYPEPPPPLRTIGRILADLGLSKRRRKGKNRGAAKYLGYPEHTVFNLLGRRVLEVDFVGKKFVKGRSEPLNFMAFSFKKEPRLRYFKRIEGETSDNFISQCKAFFESFERPDVVKMDNSFVAVGSGSAKRTISQALAFLLREKIVPVLAVPRKPFSQASIEGNNSVFGRNFWNRLEFQSVEEVDEKLEWFNVSSQKYTDYRPPDHGKGVEEFIPRIYFLRQVRPLEGGSGEGCIVIQNEKVSVPASYMNYFLIAEWRLVTEELLVYIEKEKKLELIKKLSFKVHPKTKERVLTFI